LTAYSGPDIAALTVSFLPAESHFQSEELLMVANRVSFRYFPTVKAILRSGLILIRLTLLLSTLNHPRRGR
jgi:hypothetical protein